jgi:hypothetical protein
MTEGFKTRSALIAFSLLIGAALTGCGGGGGGGDSTVASSTAPSTTPSRTTPSPFDPMTQTPGTTPASGDPSAIDEPVPAERTASTSNSPSATQAPTTSYGRTLNWTPPTDNIDGSTAANLAGYTVVYGPSSTMLHESVRIDNPSVNSYVLDTLPSGTYYVAVKAVTIEGIESDVSNVLKVVI